MLQSTNERFETSEITVASLSNPDVNQNVVSFVDDNTLHATCQPTATPAVMHIQATCSLRTSF